MTHDIEALVIDAIAKQKDLDPFSIRRDTLLTDLSITSLDAIMVVYEVEEKLDIEVPNEAFHSLCTVDDMIAGVSRLVAARE